MLKETPPANALRPLVPARSGSNASPLYQSVLDRLTADLLRVVLRAEHDAERHVDEVLRLGLTAETVCLDVFTPVARRLGVMWEEDTCTFVDVTLGVSRLQSLTHRLGARFSRSAEPGSAGRILLGTCPGEQHAFGVTMVAEFLRRDGWHVVIAPAFDGSASFVVPLESEWYDVVAISAANDRAEPRVRRLISEIRRRSRNRRLGIMCGGRLALDQGGAFVFRVGADGWAEDATGAAALAAELAGKSAPKMAPGVSRPVDTMDLGTLI